MLDYSNEYPRARVANISLQLVNSSQDGRQGHRIITTASLFLKAADSPQPLSTREREKEKTEKGKKKTKD